jgi:hypothetical protein
MLIVSTSDAPELSRAVLGARQEREHGFPRIPSTANPRGSLREHAELLYIAHVEEL